MPKAFSLDLRTRIVAAYDRKEGPPARIAELFSVSEALVRKLLRQRRQTGSIAPKPHGGGQKRRFDDTASERLREEVRKDPDATLDELCDRMEAGVGVRVCNQSMSKILRQMGLPRKKSRSTTPSVRRSA